MENNLKIIAKAFEGMPNNSNTRDALMYNIASYLMMMGMPVANINVTDKGNGKWEINVND